MGRCRELWGEVWLWVTFGYVCTCQRPVLTFEDFRVGDIDSFEGGVDRCEHSEAVFI